MAGALRAPAAKGRVKLDVVAEPTAARRKRPPVQTQGEKAAAATASPNPELEAAIEAADDNPASVAADAEKEKPSRSTKVISVVKDVVGAVDPRPSRKVPTAEEWEPVIAKGFTYLSTFYIWWLTNDDDSGEPTAQYELDDERAELIGSPFARVWARTPLNRRYGRDLIENSDILVATISLVTYVMDTRPLWVEKRSRELARQQGNNVVAMRRPQTTTARVQQQPQAPKAAAATQPTNGGTQPNEQSEREADGPYRTPLPFSPGEQNRTD